MNLYRAKIFYCDSFGEGTYHCLADNFRAAFDYFDSIDGAEVLSVECLEINIPTAGER